MNRIQYPMKPPFDANYLANSWHAPDLKTGSIFGTKKTTIRQNNANEGFSIQG
jgi:hypothetical protein